MASDVNQGDTGDCYFLASLAAFAGQRPQLIRNSVADLGDGTYAVEFYSKGKPVFVRVNDAFSVGSFHGFKFAQPGINGTVWAMVMEKAFAWFRTGANTYTSINVGWMSDVYTDLNIPSCNFAHLTFPTQNSTTPETAFDLREGRAVTIALTRRRWIWSQIIPIR